MKTSTAPLPPLRSVKVLDQLRERIRYLHYSLRTEQAYVHWVRAFIRFHGVRHPATLGSSEVEVFLSWLANERKVSASTHRQALAALLFFYGKVLCTDLPWLQEIGRPRPSRRLPVVLTPDEVVRILGFLEGSIVCSPSFCMERACGSARVCNCGSRIWISITARSSCGRQGSKDRALMLPGELGARPARAAGACPGMVAEGPGRGPQRRCAFLTPLSGSIRAPGILGRGSGSLRSTRIRPTHGAVSRRHHMYDQTFQRAFKRAVEEAGVAKPATPHTCATRSRRFCSVAVTTFEPCRICSAI